MRNPLLLSMLGALLLACGGATISSSDPTANGEPQGETSQGAFSAGANAAEKTGFAGRTGGGGGGGDDTTENDQDAGGCPSDPLAAAGTPCAEDGQVCGACAGSDPSNFCNELECR